MTLAGLWPEEGPRHAIPKWAQTDLPLIAEDTLWRFSASVQLRDYTDEVTPHFESYPVQRRTPKGVWIIDDGYRQRFVLDAGHWSERRWAYRDPRHAFKSWLIRLEWRRLYWKREGQRLDALEWLAGQAPQDWRP